MVNLDPKDRSALVAFTSELRAIHEDAVVAVARKRYNDSVRAYNTTAKKFPTNLIAGLFDFDTAEYFEAPSEAKQAPVVEF